MSPEKSNLVCESEKKKRWERFQALAPYFGRVVTANFLQKTDQHLEGVTRVHSLIEGIYKPKDMNYALAIASMLKNPYADRVSFSDEGTWYFSYSPKTGSLDLAVNKSLFNCMRDFEPVLVLKQLTDKTHKEGSRYKILGLGMIDSFDASENLFKIREVTIDQFQSRIDPNIILSDDLIETALQLEALKQWSPFVTESRAVYRVTKVKRDTAFRKIVLENYENTCAVFDSRFDFQTVVEAEAAHIIGKHINGTDDPRNGLALSKTAHWAFDKGIFTISDQYEVLVHKEARSANTKNFSILELDRKLINLPSDESYLPHPDALKWHRETVFGKFSKQ